MATRSATAPADGKRPRPLMSVVVGYDALRPISNWPTAPYLARYRSPSARPRRHRTIVFDGPQSPQPRVPTPSWAPSAGPSIVTDLHPRPRLPHPRPRCDIDHTWRWIDGGPTRPDNGHARCGPHNCQREHPPPPTRRAPPQRTPHQRAAHLQLLRACPPTAPADDPGWGYATSRS